MSGFPGRAHTVPSKSNERARLLSRIRRKFHIVTDTYLICGRPFQFTRVTDADVVLDQVVAEEDRREKLTGTRRESDELHLPYWAELWESAVGIGQFLIESAAVGGLAGLDGSAPGAALDLGCGMGFAGMVAQSVGFKVVMADLEADALLFARLNAGTCRTRKLDWRRDRLGQQFDLIIGADVLYDKTQWEYLEPFWRMHLSPRGTVLLGEPGRQTGDLFVNWIIERGWRMERFEQVVSTRPKPIRLFKIACPAT